MFANSGVLTSLVLDKNLQVLDVVAERIARIASESEVGGETRIILDDVGGSVARAVIDRGAASESGSKVGRFLLYRNRMDETRAGGEPEQETAQHLEISLY